MNAVFIPDLWEEKEKPTVNLDFSNYATKTDLNNFVLKNTLIDMNNNRVINLAAPSSNKDAVTKEYIDAQVSSRLNKAGDMMNGTLDMKGNKISRVGDPTTNDHAANKRYVDSVISSIASAIPYMKVWKFDYSGSENAKVWYRSSQLRDEKFRNVAPENVVLYASCKHTASPQVSLTATAGVLHIRDDIMTVRIQVNNGKGSPWTIDFEVFVKVIIIPSVGMQRAVRSANEEIASEQTTVYAVSQKTLRELSS